MVVVYICVVRQVGSMTRIYYYTVLLLDLLSTIRKLPRTYFLHKLDHLRRWALARPLFHPRGAHRWLPGPWTGSR
jgi:hypothetical protein